MEQLGAALQAISDLCDGDAGTASSSSSADDPISPGNVAGGGEGIKVYLPASCKSVREVLPHLRGRVAMLLPHADICLESLWRGGGMASLLERRGNGKLSGEERECQADDLPSGGSAAA